MAFAARSSSSSLWRSILGRLNGQQQHQPSSSTGYGAFLSGSRFMSSGTSFKLFVGGLSWSTDENALRDAFSSYGEISDVKVVLDRETGRSRGFGFVSFMSTEDAESAKNSMDGHNLNGRAVRVDFAIEKPPSARTFGGFGGGGSMGYGGPSGDSSFGDSSYSRPNSSFSSYGSRDSSDGGSFGSKDSFGSDSFGGKDSFGNDSIDSKDSFGSDSFGSKGSFGNDSFGSKDSFGSDSFGSKGSFGGDSFGKDNFGSGSSSKDSFGSDLFQEDAKDNSGSKSAGNNLFKDDPFWQKLNDSFGGDHTGGKDKC